MVIAKKGIRSTVLAQRMKSLYEEGVFLKAPCSDYKDPRHDINNCWLDGGLGTPPQ
ncbi:hypothetical protein MIR68_009836 [Amoeboaphelidium protococcarum]|nr:hypothetical protein MIR68_009836 [Amoeboaphelidium protococcarum]